MRSPVTGCVERQARRVQELALEAQGPACRTPDRRTTGWPIAWRWTRIWWVRPVSRRTRSSVCARQRPLELEVRHRGSRHRRCPSRAACGRAGRGRSARRSSRVRAGGRPSTSARYSRAMSRRGSAAFSARCDRLGLARRRAARTCRGPGGGRSPAAPRPRRRPRGPRAPATSVPVACPRAGCTTTPAGLSTTSRCSSSQATANGGRAAVGRRSGRARRPRRRTTTSPPRRGDASGTRRAVDQHRARRRSAAAPRARDPSGPARNASSRSPAASGRATLQLHRRAAFEDEQQRAARRT